MFDLHSHLLPGVDDGAKTPEQSAAVLARFAQQGVAGVCLTPHLLASAAAAGMPAAHVAAWEALRPLAPTGIVLYRGAEVMLDRPLDERVARDRAVTLNGTRYLLVEFPRAVAGGTVTQAVTRVVELGLVPVVAHPERYACCSTHTVQQWRQLGALMQVDGPTLLSPRSRGVRARELVQHGLADIGAGDNHGDERGLKEVWDEFHGQAGGGVAAQLLFRKNPESLLADEAPAPVAPFSFKIPMIDIVRGLFGGRSAERS